MEIIKHISTIFIFSSLSYINLLYQYLEVEKIGKWLIDPKSMASKMSTGYKLAYSFTDYIPVLPLLHKIKFIGHILAVDPFKNSVLTCESAQQVTVNTNIEINMPVETYLLINKTGRSCNWLAF